MTNVSPRLTKCLEFASWEYNKSLVSLLSTYMMISQDNYGISQVLVIRPDTGGLDKKYIIYLGKKNSVRLGDVINEGGWIISRRRENKERGKKF